MASLRKPNETPGIAPGERVRLRVALKVEAIGNRRPLACMAAELGVTGATLLEWGAAQDDDVLAGLLRARAN